MQKLLDYFKEQRGRRIELAKALNINPAAISQWERVPSGRVGKISRITGIPLEELRPDLFGTKQS